ncbi:MAG TPA: aminotransferase class I/II-fold pyridoxal phosphate-dependent enzyme, partial [Gemmatimonadaceae bacterium]|nr:aminotransferase class I/II-fold pyridoxal phosphate-dependent enzyme [Gemmatimonadaceae bacterium]
GERTGVLPRDIVLVRQGTIPRTSSGKIRRAATREALLDGTLEVVARAADAGTALGPRPSALGRSSGGDEQWLRRWLARELGREESSIDGAATLRDLGLESLDVVRLVVDAERELGARLDTGALWAAGSVDAVERQLRGGAPTTSNASPTDAPRDEDEMAALDARLGSLREAGLDDPYFVPHDGVSGATTVVGTRELVSFGSYNYLGLAGHPAVIEAAVEATRRLGTSVSASRLISGERALHRDLERELADFVGVEDALGFVSGHATNVSVIPRLVGEGDLVVADALAHDSIVQGARLSGARRLVFPHNDWAALDAMLRDLRASYRRALVVIEGVYSADGDIPDLARFVEVKQRHAALLMVDEAHSLGVLGATGRGILEHAGIAASAVDVHMGTLSKALASCGGYVGGPARLVRYLRYTAPGFVFSVGLTPASAAAALTALRVLRAEPSRVTRLRENAARFLELARAAGADTGASGGTPVVPAIVGDSLRAVRVAQRLAEAGVSAPPMVAPAVPERQARLRFFVTSEHEPAQLEHAAEALGRVLRDEPA